MRDFTDPDTVRRVCAWCSKEMGLVGGRVPYRHPVTHGMCGACSHILANFRDLPLDTLINQLGGPIMVVDENSGLVVTANEEAAAVFGKTMEEMAGQRGGNVMECVHAREPVLRTAASGDGEDQASAYQYRVTPGGIRKQHYLISTEKLEDLVLLRIEPQPSGDEGWAESL